MEIIKVVHAEPDEELGPSKQAFLLETYEFDVQDFLNRSGFNKQSWTDLAFLAGVLGAGGAAVLNIDSKKVLASLVAHKVSKAVVEDIRDKVKKVKILRLDVAKSLYPRTNNLSVGTYTLHPYDSRRLTRLESYHTNLAMEKDHELVILLGRMGAKTIRIVELGTNSADLNSAIGVGTVPADITGKVAVKSQSVSGNELLVSFAGNDVDIDENLLKTSLWFSTDSKLNSILDSRRFNPNKIEQYTLKSTYQETFDFDFDLAARFMAFNADLKAQYHSLRQKERLFHVEFSKPS